jgi:hypothetical protein
MVRLVVPLTRPAAATALSGVQAALPSIRRSLERR